MAELPPKDTLDGTPHQVIRGVVNLYKIPDLRAPANEMVTQALYGEVFTVTEEKDGIAYGQLQTDGCIGYLDMAFLSPEVHEPTHMVATPRTSIYAGPDHKPAAIGHLSLPSPLTVVAEENNMSQLAHGGWVRSDHIAPIDQPEPDFVKTAEMFVGVPYLLEHRSGYGLDCTALVQLSLARAGVPVPRHTYEGHEQYKSIGEEVPAEDLQRGDIVYFPGHVGIMLDADTILHAEYIATCVIVEPLSVAIEKKGAITTVRRMPSLVIPTVRPCA